MSQKYATRADLVREVAQKNEEIFQLKRTVRELGDSVRRLERQLAEEQRRRA